MLNPLLSRHRQLSLFVALNALVTNLSANVSPTNSRSPATPTSLFMRLPSPSIPLAFIKKLRFIALLVCIISLYNFLSISVFLLLLSANFLCNFANE